MTKKMSKNSKTNITPGVENGAEKCKSISWAGFYREHQVSFDFSKEDIMQLISDETFTTGEEGHYIWKCSTYQEALVLATIVKTHFLRACSECGVKIPVRIMVSDLYPVVEGFIENKEKPLDNDFFNFFYDNQLKMAPYVLIEVNYPAKSLEAVAIKKTLANFNPLSNMTNNYAIYLNEKGSFQDAVLEPYECMHLKSFREDLLKNNFLYNYFFINDNKIFNTTQFLQEQDFVDDYRFKLGIRSYAEIIESNDYNGIPPLRPLVMKMYKVEYSLDETSYYGIIPQLECNLVYSPYET